MRTIILILLLSGCFLSSYAQDTAAVAPLKKDTVWRNTVAFGANLTNVGLSNWAGGGQSSVAATAFFIGNANYQKKRIRWNSLLDVAYGFQRLGSKEVPFRKSEDKIYALTKVSYNLINGDKMLLTSYLDFRSQFAPGFQFYDQIKYDSSVYISNFLAPAYVNFGLGIESRPVKNLVMVLAPVTLKYTIVNSEILSNAGAFGVTPGSRFRQELGASFLLKYKIDLMKNVTYTTMLNLFSNYQNFNVDVFWDNIVYLKVNKFLTTTFTTNLIYDDDVNVRRDDGSVGPATQFKHVLSIGILYKINNFGTR
ncbi:MAG: DUF3078 domain-containing protein [Cytophagaceae bacterium]|jgi:hypothetical protein|nr:DUF3078 domain-containing protein [Cytophagaceae bacterium]